jgi:plastocyanin
MQPLTPRRLLAAAAVAAAALGVAGSALAATAGSSSKARIAIKGGESFKPNAFIRDTQRYVPGTTPIRSGGTVTLANATTEPHTLSIVKAGDLPRTIGQVENCSICGDITRAHGVDPNGPPPEGPPPNPVVDVGGSGFDQPGDSIFVGPKGSGSTVRFKVTAKAGTTLHYICIIHPWMQGRLTVK